MAKKKKPSVPKKVVTDNLEEAKKIEVNDPMELVSYKSGADAWVNPEDPDKGGSPESKIIEGKASPTGNEILKAYLISSKGQKTLKQNKRGGNFIDKMTGEIYIPISVVEQIIKA